MWQSREVVNSLVSLARERRFESFLCNQVGGDVPPMNLDLSITEKQDLFMKSEAFETLFGGAAGGG